MHQITSVFRIRRGMMIQTLFLSLGTIKFDKFMYQTASAVFFCAANFQLQLAIACKTLIWSR